MKELQDPDAGADRARDRLLKLVDESSDRAGPNRKWSREDAYEGRMLPTPKTSIMTKSTAPFGS